jgi:hypothetical protein
VEVPDTATPFHYLFLGTEPGITTLTPSTQEGIPGEDIGLDVTPDVSVTSTRQSGFSITAESGFSNGSSSSGTQSTATDSGGDVIILPGTQRPTLTVGPALPTRTPTLTRVPSPTPTNRGASKTPINLQTLLVPTNTLAVTLARTSTPTRTATSASTAPLNAGTYDDTDSHLVYSGTWTNQNNVQGAYQSTLHVSSTLGNLVTFRFIGQEVRLFYQSGPSLGKLRVIVDDREFELDQFDTSTFTSEWVSATLTNGTHTVTIRHAEGGSVNLDEIIVPEVTPTLTPTPN